jgi:hypothetical protein
MATESEIIAKGKADYFSLKGAYKNPYPPASEEFNHYERGWTQSLKYDDGRLLNALSRPAPKLFPPRPNSVNQYAALKGRDGPRKK